MHVSGISLDLSSIFLLVLTLLVFSLVLLHIVKKTASKYFVVDANFEGGVDVDVDDRRGAERDRMVVTSDACFVCGNLTKKKCSGCKAVWYCSSTCQTKHWKEDHRLKCKEIKLFDNEKSISTASSSCKRRKPSGWVENASTSAALVPARGICKVLEKPKKVLFPYDEFVKLFNWDKPGFPPCGLLNCGNSCFANVVLQCLACTRPLVAYLLEKGHTNECKRNDWCFLCELQVHVSRVSQSSQPFSPISILSRLPNIGGNLGYGKQEDAHEFMRFAIDTMQSVCLDEFGGEKALNPSTQETTLIQHIFGGHLQSQVICSKCNQISNRYENMMDLTVEIQGDAASLEDCLDQFTVKEWLDGENMYKCDGCNDYVKAWKRLTVHQAPNILTVALKRFQSGRFGKLNKRVTFPETLDLSPYMSEAGDGTHLYRLYAVVVHVDMLNASYFGHYICYTKDFCGNWYRIDDCKVMKVEVDEVLAQGAYMLLYCRIHVRQPCVKPLEPARKEEERETVGVVREALKCGIEPVESSSIGESMDSASSPECLSSDIHLKSTEFNHGKELYIRTGHESYGEDLEDVDLNDSIKVNSKLIREDAEDVDMSNPESTSVVSKDLEEWDLSYCSHALENVLPVKILHRDKLGESTDSGMFSELSVEFRTVESEDSGTKSIVDCSFEEENSSRSNWDKELRLPKSSPDDSLSNINIVHQIAERSETSSSVSIALRSEMEPSEEAGLSHSPLDLKLKQVAATNYPSDSNIGITKSGKVFLANGSAKANTSIAAGDNYSSGGQSKPLFSRGFLDKPARRKFLREDKAQIETGEIGPSGTVDINCNGVAASVHSVTSNGMVYNHDESEETIYENRNIHILDHEKPLISLNKEEEAKKELDDVAHPCNTDCNGFHGTVFSDQNGSKISYHEDASTETYCGAGTDLLLDHKPSLSSGFLNKPTGKKSLSKDAEAHKMDGGHHLRKPEGNCNEPAVPIFGHQNGNRYRPNGIPASVCQNGKEVVLGVEKSLVTPDFFDKPSKMKLQNEVGIAQKDLGGVGQSIISNTSCNGSANPVFADKSGSKHLSNGNMCI